MHIYWMGWMVAGTSGSWTLHHICRAGRKRGYIYHRNFQNYSTKMAFVSCADEDRIHNVVVHGFPCNIFYHNFYAFLLIALQARTRCPFSASTVVLFQQKKIYESFDHSLFGISINFRTQKFTIISEKITHSYHYRMAFVERSQQTF